MSTHELETKIHKKKKISNNTEAHLYVIEVDVSTIIKIYFVSRYMKHHLIRKMFMKIKKNQTLHHHLVLTLHQRQLVLTL